MKRLSVGSEKLDGRRFDCALEGHEKPKYMRN